MSATIEKLSQTLSSARSKSAGKPIANNTRLFERGNGSIAVQLHSTDVVTYHTDGSFTLDSGGWQTVTTKDRINSYSECRVYSIKGTWYVTYQGKQFQYADGMTLFPNGEVKGADEYSPELEKLANKKRTRIKNYAKLFVDALYKGKIAAPSAGDCFFCQMVVADGKDKGKPLGEACKDRDHIESHLSEKYFVPSLLYRALESFDASQVERETVWKLTHNDKPSWPGAGERDSYSAKHIEKYVSKYVMRQLGMAV